MSCRPLVASGAGEGAGLRQQEEGPASSSSLQPTQPEYGLGASDTVQPHTQPPPPLPGRCGPNTRQQLLVERTDETVSRVSLLKHSGWLPLAKDKLFP